MIKIRIKLFVMGLESNIRLVFGRSPNGLNTLGSLVALTSFQSHVGLKIKYQELQGQFSLFLLIERVAMIFYIYIELLISSRPEVCLEILNESFYFNCASFHGCKIHKIKQKGTEYMPHVIITLILCHLDQGNKGSRK